MTAFWKCDLSKPLAESFTFDLGGGGWGNDEAQNYTNSPENAFVKIEGEEDVLVVRAIARPDGKVTSARLVSRQTFERSKGYVSARITVPLSAGIWPAFWALPKKPFSWPYDGEVDIVETWNGLQHNGTCLHNGHYDGRDWDKHRVLKTPTPHLDRSPGHSFGFAWEGDGEGARLLWFTDGRATMRACVPAGTRSMRDYQIIMNIAVGGNVQEGKLPAFPSQHDLEVRDLAMTEEPPCGWGKGFDEAWAHAKDGDTM